MIRVHGLTNCDTVKTARAWLDAHHVAHEFVDIKKRPPSRDKLREWCEAAGIERVLNRRGTTWRGLDVATQATAATLEGAVSLLCANTSAIRRPVVETDEGLLFGFDETEYESRFVR